MMTMISVDQESAIRQLLARSSDCVWRKDTENYAQCWATDGEWRILGTETKGRDNIKSAWAGHMNPLIGAWQAASSLTFAAEGEEIIARIYLEETLYLKTGGITLTRGVYHDRYRIENDVWVFGKRHYDMIYIGPADMTGRVFQTINYGPAPYDPDPTRAATPSFAEVYG